MLESARPPPRHRAGPAGTWDACSHGGSFLSNAVYRLFFLFGSGRIGSHNDEKTEHRMGQQLRVRVKRKARLRREKRQKAAARKPAKK